jgi:hypothetical protein
MVKPIRFFLTPTKNGQVFIEKMNKGKKKLEKKDLAKNLSK